MEISELEGGIEKAAEFWKFEKGMEGLDLQHPFSSEIVQIFDGGSRGRNDPGITKKEAGGARGDEGH